MATQGKVIAIVALGGFFLGGAALAARPAFQPVTGADVKRVAALVRFFDPFTLSSKKGNAVQVRATNEPPLPNGSEPLGFARAPASPPAAVHGVPHMRPPFRPHPRSPFRPPGRPPFNPPGPPPQMPPGNPPGPPGNPPGPPGNPPGPPFNPPGPPGN